MDRGALCLPGWREWAALCFFLFLVAPPPRAQRGGGGKRSREKGDAVQGRAVEGKNSAQELFREGFCLGTQLGTSIRVPLWGPLPGLSECPWTVGCFAGSGFSDGVSRADILKCLFYLFLQIAEAAPLAQTWEGWDTMVLSEQALSRSYSAVLSQLVTAGAVPCFRNQRRRKLDTLTWEWLSPSPELYKTSAQRLQLS